MNTKREEVIKNNLSLVRRVILGRFQWAINSTPTSRILRKAIDLDDLIQVGTIGLINAVDSTGYDQLVGNFESYAAQSVYNELMTYIGINTTPVTMPRWRSSFNNNSEEVSDKRIAAGNCCSLSEIEPHGDFMRMGTRVYDDAVADLHEKWETNDCVAKLKCGLTEEEYTYLLHHTNGKSMRCIAEDENISIKYVRKIIRRAKKKSHSILRDEIKESS